MAEVFEKGRSGAQDEYEYEKALTDWQLRHDEAEIKAGLAAAEKQKDRAHEELCAQPRKD